MELVYGTYNPAKLESMKQMLLGLNIRVLGLDSIDKKLTESKEDGKDPLSNAIQKAMTYYNQIKRPVFSCDSGLYFEEVLEYDQPGVKIKRINGRSLTSYEMLEYYSGLAMKYGGKLTAYYKNAICLVLDENTIYTYDGEDIHSEKFYMVDKPHHKYQEGFPLDSISVDIRSMQYYYDLEDKQSENLGITEGVREFFIRSQIVND